MTPLDEANERRREERRAALLQVFRENPKGLSRSEAKWATAEAGTAITDRVLENDLVHLVADGNIEIIPAPKRSKATIMFRVTEKGLEVDL